MILFFAVIVWLAASCGGDTRPGNDVVRARKEKTHTSDHIEMPVVILPCTDGRNDDTFTTDEQYPRTVSVYRDSFTAQSTIYGAAYQVWIGPKGWQGTGETAPDGTVYVRLHPVNDSSGKGPRISYDEIPTCQGCIFEAAAPYFPGAMKIYAMRFNNGKRAPIPAGLKITQLSPSLLTYTLPDKNGLSTLGVAHYLPPDTLNDAYFTEARFILPSDQKPLANFFAAKFIELKKLR